MKWIGLTGGLGTGKSTVAAILRDLGYVVLDADEIARDVVGAGQPGLKLVADRFGSDFINSTGELNREKMSKHVFSHPEALRDLESIIHPLVQAEVQSRRSAAHQRGDSLVFYDVPLLYEKNITGFDHVIVVSTSPSLQLARLRARNPSWSDEEIQRRLRNQLALEAKVKKADIVIHNDGTLEELRAQVEAVVSRL